MNAPLPQAPSSVATFAQLLSSTRRGARLARLLATTHFRAWGLSPDVTERAEQIVAELAANAALHGRVQGRDFRLALTLDTATGVLRIAVTDAKGGQLPVAPTDSAADSESGRGLLMVDALADHWGTESHPPGGKTVWAEVSHRSR
ncbi:ATP-binding protein [Streptomyces griseorubiginosus]|uniref:ATP-binding protein n=1 Tax=Streptomyces griseorubiginosus TaxID=67304 RepID=UPI002E819235|nr:ATP-binding protein [Streptomyces griseorubiginosus]WUB47517.1 ATP-binding protein [Streptomyces griseorubiginosus]WUB56042.1 ATP-binding protein [Streptomyces griseorubiginosus]